MHTRLLKLRPDLTRKGSDEFASKSKRGPPLIVVLDRSLCERGGASSSSNASASGHRTPVRRCHRGRGVKHQREITAALMNHFGREASDLRHDVVTLTGTEPYVDQGAAFYQAAVIVGPHGAAQANMIFAQPHAAMVEFVSGTRSTNSALYAGYASIFYLSYWVVVSESSNGSYDSISPSEVVQVVSQALAHRKSGLGNSSSTFEFRHEHGHEQRHEQVTTLYADQESPLVRGYGVYQENSPTGW